MTRSRWGTIAIIGTLLSGPLTASRARAAEEPSGPDILQRCAVAYGALPGYVGTSKAYEVVQIHYDEDDAAILHTNKTVASARVLYSRPAALCVAGKDSDGREFTVICNDKDGWTAWPLEAKGTFTKAPSRDLALAKMSGVAVKTPTTISALVLGRAWGNPILWPATATLLGHETVDGVDCYKVMNLTPVRTDTFWVDSATFLLHRYQRAENEDQLKQASVLEADDNQTFVQEDPPQNGTKSRMRTESYFIESLQPPANTTLFNPPVVGTKPAPRQGHQAKR